VLAAEVSPRAGAFAVKPDAKPVADMPMKNPAEIAHYAASPQPVEQDSTNDIPPSSLFAHDVAFLTRPTRI